MTFKDAERQIDTFASSAVESNRTQILSGDIRSVELRLKKELGINPGESLLFLDEKRAPWLGDLRIKTPNGCPGSGRLCRDWLHRRLTLERPIYFDEGGKQIWGYLHIEKSPKTNVSFIFSVLLAVVLGMFFQGIGFYFSMVRSIRTISQTLASWAQRLSTDPKDSSQYPAIPFTEIEPIGRALSGLKDEIDALEHAARQQGALTTLRGVGHDILNPVSRMKRILGLLEMEGGASPELLLTLGANLKRLSGYAEQLKMIYRQQSGETVEKVAALDLSKEIGLLTQELISDPDCIKKNIQLRVRVEPSCYARVPTPAFGRVIENLCSNSIHASPPGSSISLAVQREGDRVVVSVEDEGAGIKEEDQSRIFEPDFTTKTYLGTGLGLFVVKQVCHQYGGEITFRSKLGQGTAFRIEFPRIEVANELQAAVSR